MLWCYNVPPVVMTCDSQTDFPPRLLLLPGRCTRCAFYFLLSCLIRFLFPASIPHPECTVLSFLVFFSRFVLYLQLLVGGRQEREGEQRERAEREQRERGGEQREQRAESRDRVYPLSLK